MKISFFLSLLLLLLSLDDAHYNVDVFVTLFYLLHNIYTSVKRRPFAGRYLNRGEKAREMIPVKPARASARVARARCLLCINVHIYTQRWLSQVSRQCARAVWPSVEFPPGCYASGESASSSLRKQTWVNEWVVAQYQHHLVDCLYSFALMYSFYSLLYWRCTLKITDTCSTHHIKNI